MKCYKREVSYRTFPIEPRGGASEVNAFAYTVLLVVSRAMVSGRIRAYAREPRSDFNCRIGMRYLDLGRSREWKGERDVVA
jgi:hypothetical protein